MGEKMRHDWDERAKHGAFYVSRAKSEAEFRKVGRADASTIITGLSEPDLRKMLVLDVGCGIGRLERYLAGSVGELHGIDVSLSMIQQAKESVSNFDNVFFHLGSGHDLRQFRDETFDFIFSYITFQHIPRKIFYQYLPEIWRVLKSGGRVRFQVLSLRIPKRFFVWIRRMKNHNLDIQFEPSDDDTWSMRFYDRPELLKTLEKIGFANVIANLRPCSKVSPVSMMWITAEKKTHTSVLSIIPSS